MSTLYICEQGSTLSIDGGRFVLRDLKDCVRTIPKEILESIIVFGNISITTPCIQECLKRGIPISYFSTKGSYFGRLESTSHRSPFRLKKQVKLSSNSEFTLNWSREIIGAKIHNQKVILQRYKGQNEKVIKAIYNIQKLESSIKKVKLDSELIGFEGLVARIYFEALSELVTDNFKFKGRSRRPPRDPFNSMLSLGYTLLMYEIVGEIENKKMSPYIGFLHKDAENHPTLASDLMEEWRSIIVDSVVLSLIRGNEVKKEGFQINGKGVFLDKDTLRVFLRKFENKIKTLHKYIDSENQMSFRQAIGHQIRSFVRVIEHEDINLYRSVRIR